MSLLDRAKEDIIKQIRSEISRMFGEELADLQNIDLENGTADSGELTFTYAAGYLRLYGPCPMCPKNVPSAPIRRPSDLFDQMHNFKPMKHDCMDT
jgi:hypothetical protein